MVSVFATNGVEMESKQHDRPEAAPWGPVGLPPELWREPDEIVATNVRRVRKLRGLSGRELEERAGLRGRYVSDLERGRLKSGPSVSEVVRIALALSVSPLALVLPWDEGPDEGTALYVKQGTFGVIFPSGIEGVEAAARLWTGRLSPAFAHVVNGHEYRTTLPAGFKLDGDDGVGAATILEDGTLVFHDGPKGVPSRDSEGVLRYHDGPLTILEDGTHVYTDGTSVLDAPDRYATTIYPDGRTFRPRGWPEEAPSLSLETGTAGGQAWTWAGPTAPTVELLEEGPLFEQLRAAREGAEIEADDDEGGRS